VSKPIAKTKKVDEVTVCVATGHTLDFQCKYPLGTRTVKNTFDVSGHDADVDAEGVGELKYTLSVSDNNVDIGDKVAVTVTPLNKNLVFAQLNDCNVQYKDQSVSVLDFNAGSAGSGAWPSAPDSMLEGLTSYGNVHFETYEEAEAMCRALPADECGGVTFEPMREEKRYQPRRQNDFLSAASGERSWRRVDGKKAANLQPVCGIGANIGTASGQSDLKFDWQAFKWATANKDADKELQTISCTISLSKDAPVVESGDCGRK